jgi:hypothetical protein
MPTYTGGCHCRANKYTATINPGLDSPDFHATQCNCSICSTNAYLHTFINEADVKWEAGGPGTLKEYTFNTKALTHSFCGQCGTSVSVAGEMGGSRKMMLNVSFLSCLM